MYDDVTMYIFWIVDFPVRFFSVFFEHKNDTAGFPAHFSRLAVLIIA